MDDLINVCAGHMVSDEFTEEQARAYMQQLLPKLDYRKGLMSSRRRGI